MDMMMMSTDMDMMMMSTDMDVMMMFTDIDVMMMFTDMDVHKDERDKRCYLTKKHFVYKHLSWEY
jgi:hypothetical protein